MRRTVFLGGVLVTVGAAFGPTAARAEDRIVMPEWLEKGQTPPQPPSNGGGAASGTNAGSNSSSGNSSSSSGNSSSGNSSSSSSRSRSHDDDDEGMYFGPKAAPFPGLRVAALVYRTQGEALFRAPGTEYEGLGGGLEMNKGTATGELFANMYLGAEFRGMVGYQTGAEYTQGGPDKDEDGQDRSGGFVAGSDMSVFFVPFWWKGPVAGRLAARAALAVDINQHRYYGSLLYWHVGARLSLGFVGKLGVHATYEYVPGSTKESLNFRSHRIEGMLTYENFGAGVRYTIDNLRPSEGTNVRTATSGTLGGVLSVSF